MVAKESGNEHGWRLMYVFLYSGARCAEILTITRKEIDTENWTMAVLNNKTYEKEARLIGIHPEIREHVAWFLENGHGKSKIKLNSIEPRKPFRICSEATASKWAHDWFRKADISSMKLHSLRHIYATWAVEKNVNIRHLQESLGHSTVRVTENFYIHGTKGGGRIIEI